MANVLVAQLVYLSHYLTGTAFSRVQVSHLTYVSLCFLLSSSGTASTWWLFVAPPMYVPSLIYSCASAPQCVIRHHGMRHIVFMKWNSHNIVRASTQVSLIIVIFILVLKEIVPPCVFLFQTSQPFLRIFLLSLAGSISPLSWEREIIAMTCGKEIIGIRLV